MKLSNYLNDNDLNKNKMKKQIKVAFLSSFTINGIPESVKSKCKEISVDCKIFHAPYDQYSQEIINSTSQLYKFNPDITFLIISTRDLIHDDFYFYYNNNIDERKIILTKLISKISNLIKLFQKNLDSKLVITNFPTPTYSPYGICDFNNEFGFKEFFNSLNKKLYDEIKKFQSVYVLDFNSFIMKHGESNVFDYKQFFLGDIQISLKSIPSFADEIVGFIKPVLGLTKKCIVLDLDNTLWGGIIGEDGLEGISLSKKSPGNSFIEFQKKLLSLNNRGIILAINSKNNYDDAMNVIRNHPDMILRENNFACIKINWDNKVTNMKSISKELNLGLDSFVFFDDDPVNREIMRKVLPEILTVELPKDSAQYSKILQEISDFNVLKITDEDKNRNQMYVQNRKRIELSSDVTSLDEFLKELDISIKIKKSDNFTIPRISQLTLKTNQFNLTTKRYQEEQIRKLSSDDKKIVSSVEVSDKFGNSGITAVFIIEKLDHDEWNLDTFLLSCRVMGRNIENAIMSYIINQANKNGVKKITASYIPTNKNIPCSSFLKEFGFKNIEGKWMFEINGLINIPEYIQIE